jgi:hypothetical protein
MSHHLDSPLARQDPRLNITDHYLFDDDSSIVFVLNVRTSLAGDKHADPFHPEARYEFKVHVGGGPREDLTYRFAFGPGQDDGQPFTVERLTGEAAADDGAAGTVIARGRTGQALATDEGGRLWTGQAVEPFFLDLSQLDAVDQTIMHGDDQDLTHWVSGNANDTFTGSTVLSIVLTVPVGTRDLCVGQPIATWCTTKLATDAGGWRQVGRTGLPMIWPLFRDAATDAASQANETVPADDVANYHDAISDLVSSVVRRRGTSERPEDYAAEVVGRILPDLLPYVVGSPALFSFARFNGRRLADNAPEVMFSLAMNSAIPTGLRAGDVKRGQGAFPFVVPVTEL